MAEKPEETIKVIQKFCEKLKGSGQKKAKRIPVMPKVVYQKHVEDAGVSFENIPIGLNVDTAEPVCINLKKRNVGQVLAMDKQDIVAFAEGLAQMLQQMFCGELYVIDVGKALTIEGMDKEHYVTEKPEEIIVKLFQITRDRNNEYKKSNGEAANAMYEHPIIVMLMGVGQIKRLLSEDGKDKLRVILEKTSGKYGLFFWAVDDYQSSNRQYRDMV